VYVRGYSIRSHPRQNRACSPLILLAARGEPVEPSRASARNLVSPPPTKMTNLPEFWHSWSPAHE